MARERWSSSECAKYLGISVRTWQRWVAEEPFLQSKANRRFTRGGHARWFSDAVRKFDDMRQAVGGGA